MWYNLLDVGLHEHIRTAEIVGSSVRSGEISHTSPISIVIHPQYNSLSVQS